MTEHPLLGVAKSTIETLASNNPFLFFYNFKVPPSLRHYGDIEPYLHQVDILSRGLCRRPVRLLVGDEIGLGKTVEALILARYLELRNEIDRVLILVPRTLVSHWLKDLLRIGIGLDKIRPITRNNFQRLAGEEFPPAYYISSIDLLKEDRGPNQYRTVVSKARWDLIIVDEAHNLTRRAGRGVSLKTELVRGLVKDPSKHTILLSATPHRGDPDDYLARLAMIDPWLVPTRNLDNKIFYELTHNTLIVRRTKEVVNEAERRQIFTKCNFNAMAIQPSTEEEEFEKLLSNFLRVKLGQSYEHERGKPTPLALLLIIIRKRASSSPYAALRTFEKVLRGVGLRKQYGEEYKKILAQEAGSLSETVFGIAFEDIEETEDDVDDAINNFAEKCGGILDEADVPIIKRLVELVGRISDVGDTKLAAVLDILDKHLRRGEKVIVFTEYRDTLNYVINSRVFRDRYDQDSYRAITGSTATPEFDTIVEHFTQDPKCKVLIATDVISEGRDLQVANVVVNYEASWSLVKFEQRIGRVWRLGQKRDVEAYTLFKATPTELDVLENLYAKLMATESALEHARPLLGDRVYVAYRGTSESAERMWRIGSPVAVVEVDEKEGKALTEGDLVLAAIRGNLSNLVNEIIRKLQMIRNEIATKQVFPRAKAEEIRRTVSSSTGFDDASCAYSALKLLAESIITASQGDLNLLHRYSSPRELVEYLRNALRHVEVPRDPLILVDPEAEETVFIAQADLHLSSFPSRSLGSQPCIVSEVNGSQDVLIGSKVVEYLGRTISRRLISPTEIAFNFSFPNSVEAKIENQIRSYLNPLLESFKKYVEETTRHGWRNPAPVQENISIVISPLGIILGSRASFHENEQNERAKRLVELKAMEVAIRHERNSGRDPRDVHESAHWDIESTDPLTKDVRYVEVKGHFKNPAVYGELTEPEHEAASRLGDSYWLYVVSDIGSDKNNLLCFRNPLRSLNIEVVKRVKVEEERRFLLRP